MGVITIKHPGNPNDFSVNHLPLPFRTKLGVTTAQVQDQAAYVKQLETTEADHQLIGQEKLVEKQLRRRMVNKVLVRNKTERL